MKSGDIFEWIFRETSQFVEFDRMFYSSTLSAWVPIGGKSFLISITTTEMAWFHFNTMRVLQARIVDTDVTPYVSGKDGCYPRTIESYYDATR